MEKNLIIDIKILKYDSSFNHPEKEYDEMRFICSEYNSIKSHISRNLNKNFHPMEYNDDIFVDGTFFIAPKFKLDSFYTTSFAILQNKEQEIYKIFKKLKKNANTCNNNIIIAESIQMKSVLIERYKNYEAKLMLNGIEIILLICGWIVNL
ncbi:hypothetical protein H8356DRAFT_1341066 [Neocallimastix lanati (nom. inval.)]|nr:hypothetical protein H8356DRAFT_1341066 [Neocallimastix sp. JGI-2020a]